MEARGIGRTGGAGPISLRVSVTDRCSLRCLFCMPAEGMEKFPRAEILRYEEVHRFIRLVRGRFGLAKVRITGGEPLARKGIVGFVEMLAGEGLEDLAMTTNGQALAPLAADLKRAGLRRVNISLYTLDPRTFEHLTRGGDLARTMEGIEAALRAGLAPVKTNTIVLRGVNDGEVGTIARFGIERGIEARFIELMPVGPAAARHKEWFVPASEIMARLREGLRLQPLPPRRGASATRYEARDGDGNLGVVGVIPSFTEPFCGECNRLRLTADGRLVGCLAADGATPIAPLLREAGAASDERILETASDVLERKRARRGFWSGRYMARTGG